MSYVMISDPTYVTTIAANGPALGTIGHDALFRRYMWCINEGATASAAGEWAAAGTTGTIGYVSRTAATLVLKRAGLPLPRFIFTNQR